MSSDARKEMLEILFGFPRSLADYLVNISPRYGYLYFEVPKVACSTVKRTLQFLEVTGKDFEVPDDVHNKCESPLCSPLDIVRPLSREFLGGRFKFCFVRNPFTRILSCYIDKILNSQWEKDSRKVALGFPGDAEITFLEFLQAIELTKPFEMDIHWMPQFHLLGGGKIDFDFIGRQESFNSDFTQVLRRIGHLNCPILTSDGHGVGASSRMSEFYCPESEEIVRRVYRDDFKHFGYGFDRKLAERDYV